MDQFNQLCDAVLAESKKDKRREETLKTVGEKLKEFAALGSMKDPLKVRRALNYLTCSAFRIGIISSDEITQLREEVREAWKELLAKG